MYTTCTLFLCNKNVDHPARLKENEHLFFELSSRYSLELAGLLPSPAFPAFLHINKVPSSILLNEVPSPIQMRCLPPY